MFRKAVISIFMLLAASHVLRAQANDDYVPAVLVTINGDSIHGLIKTVRDDRFSKSISFYRNGSDTQEKFSPKEIRYFRFEDQEYLSRLIDGKEYFVRQIISGDLSLFEYAYRTKKGNKSQTDYRYFIEKKSTSQWAELSFKNFRNPVLPMIEDYPALTKKVDDKYYTFKEKEAVVEEYNEWTKQGKPGNTWRIEDGNFTRPEKEYIPKPQTKEPRKYNSQLHGSRLGIEFPLYASYGFVSYPEQLNVVIITTSNGFGYDVGTGVRFNALPSLSLHAGIHFWNKRFHSYYLAYDSNQNPPQTYNVDEYGTIHYMGMYATADYEVSNVVVGGGFIFSFWNMYRADYRIKNSSGAVINNDSNVSQSILTDKFNNQFDFTMHFGYKFSLFNKQLKLKPTFRYTMPMLHLFEFSDPSLKSYGLSGFLLQLGITADIGFKVKS